MCSATDWIRFLHRDGSVQHEQRHRYLFSSWNTIYRSLLGHEGRRVEPLVQAAEEIYAYLFGQKIKPESPDRASIWTDTNVYNELGIPAIKIGPRGRRISARNEEIDVDVMLKAAQIYALIALDICSRERPRVSS